ncbi:NAD(P)H-dependent oxidoreductase [Cysteiniphilum sp. 6C5]|uniref:NAD(P)H-dependent oxidoreductase n=1 Tax=unclassified Cysteiniphilum TaxID=2610889 RepID=UPI003F857F3D
MPFDILLISTSMKKTKSLSRELMTHSQTLLEKFMSVKAIDLSMLPIPLFEGKALNDYLPQLQYEIDHAKKLMLFLTGYWGGLSGASKNFLDLLGGVNYNDTTQTNEYYQQKDTSIVVVGSDTTATENAAKQAETSAHLLGFNLIDSPCQFNNFRNANNPDVKSSYLSLYGQIQTLFQVGNANV